MYGEDGVRGESAGVDESGMTMIGNVGMAGGEAEQMVKVVEA